MKLPFVNEVINTKLKKVIIESRLPIALAQKGYSLKNFFGACNRNRSVRKCNKDFCHLASNSLCMQSRVVYLLTCNGCGAKYIGSTLRTLHTRFEEHMTKKDSSVFDHKLSCKADFGIAILGRRREETI